MDLRIGPEEEELIGGGFSDNTLDQRIARLTAGFLQRIAATNGGWDVLFQDPQDGRYWEMTHPHSEMHGGGPVHCATLPIRVAREKYAIL
jgi:hypothetical protein